QRRPCLSGVPCENIVNGLAVLDLFQRPQCFINENALPLVGDGHTLAQHVDDPLGGAVSNFTDTFQPLKRIPPLVRHAEREPTSRRLRHMPQLHRLHLPKLFGAGGPPHQASGPSSSSITSTSMSMSTGTSSSG